MGRARQHIRGAAICERRDPFADVLGGGRGSGKVVRTLLVGFSEDLTPERCDEVMKVARLVLDTGRPHCDWETPRLLYIELQRPCSRGLGFIRLQLQNASRTNATT